jgi:hypothetical protein
MDTSTPPAGAPWRLLAIGALSVAAAACGGEEDATRIIVGSDLSGELPTTADLPGAWGHRRPAVAASDARITFSSDLELEVAGDELAAYLFAWGTGGDRDGGRDGVALVRVGDVTSFVSVHGSPPDELYDTATLAAVVQATVAHLTDGQAAPGVIQDGPPPEREQPADVFVDGDGAVVVRPGDGCRFIESGLDGYGVSAPGDFADELRANTNWFVEQVFAIERDVTINVRRDDVAIVLNGAGSPPPDRSEALADDLRAALGRHAIC